MQPFDGNVMKGAQIYFACDLLDFHGEILPYPGTVTISYGWKKDTYTKHLIIRLSPTIGVCHFNQTLPDRMKVSCLGNNVYLNITNVQKSDSGRWKCSTSDSKSQYVYVKVLCK